MTEPTDAHRKVYDLLVNKHQGGLTRDDLATHSGLGDRQMRKVIEELRTIAATTIHPRLGRPVVIGFDPELERYVAAQNAAQARRVTAYYRSYVHPMLEALRAQERAINHYKTEAEQDALFAAPKRLDTRYIG